MNTDSRKDLTAHLPINGSVTYESAKVNLFRGFPDFSIQLEGIHISDSLSQDHGYAPLSLDKLKLDAKLVDWGRKKFAVNHVDLEGLTINLFDREDGFSNIAGLIRKKVKQKVEKSKKDKVSIEYDNVSVNISDLKLNKIDEQIDQQANVAVGDIKIRNKKVGAGQDLAIDIHNVGIGDSPSNDKTKQAVRLNEVSVHVLADDDYSFLQMKEVNVSDGNINLFNDLTNQSNHKKLFGVKLKAKSKSQKPRTDSKPSINIDGVIVQLEGIDIAVVDEVKNKHIAARLAKLATVVQANQDTSANVDLNLDIDQLAFNTIKGAYLSNSLVQGNLQVAKSKEIIGIDCPDLLINDEKFNVNAKLVNDKSSPTLLTIEKSDAETKSIRPLLTNAIQNSIATYDVQGPFYAKAHVQFIPGKKDPRVEVDLRVNNKTVKAKGQSIKNAKLEATFVNRLYDDARQHSEDKRNVRFMIHTVQGVFNGLQMDSKNALITSTPNGGDRLVAKANISGSASAASRYLKHDNFYFEDGNFNLSTDINGSLNNLDDLITGTNLNLSMDDLQVHYPAGNTIFPFRILELNKEGEKTTFHFEGYTEKEKRPFHIRGEVDRVESILFPGRGDRMQAKAHIRASSVSWEGVIALFGKEGIMSSFKKADEKQAKRSMKQTLAGIQQSFHPEVRITIDTVLYGKDIELLNFQSGVKFNDERTLVLEETSFNLEEANVTLDGELKINELDFTRFDFDVELNHLDFDALMPKFDYFGVHLIKQIHDQPDNLMMKIKLTGELDDNAGLKPESINADIMYESFAEDKFTGQIKLKANPSTKKVDVVFGHSGHPRSFNHLLGADKYRFDNGWYTVSFQFDDNFKSLAQMVEESTFNLTIDDAEVYMIDLDMTIPLTRIEVASIRNKAYYHLLLRSDSLNQEIAFNGIVNNIRHFAFKDTKEPYEIELEISSPRIVWDDLKQLIAFQKKDSAQTKSGKALKESFTQVLKDFNPNVSLKLNELVYSDQIRFEDIFAHAYLEGNHLIIDSANVDYGKSSVRASLNADMGHADVLPFQMKLKLDEIDVGQTLTHFDYFNVAALREAKQLEGNVWLDLILSAEMDLENQGFITEKTVGEVNVRLEDVVIEDLHMIDTIAEGLGREKRFEVLRLAPIESRVKIKGQRLEVYETEIQSNAIHAFVEGTIDKTSPENLWISVPLSNIKKPNLEETPDKTGYGAAGRKLYLELISSEDEDNGKMKVHLRKKKFFQQRFKAKQFRAYKRINRRARKKVKRAKRQAN